MGYEKEVVTEGSGPTPQKGQTVTVHCTGNLINPTRKFWWYYNAPPPPNAL
jgi:peptidylprolyl isomerase